MGNKTAERKVVIINELDSSILMKFYRQFDQNEADIAHHGTFETFIEKENLRKLSHIILLEKKRQKQQIDERQNLLLNLSPFKKKNFVGNREKLIEHLRRYSIDGVNLYIFTQHLTDLKIQEYQKPYIKLVTSHISLIKDSILKQKKIIALDIKFKKMVQDLYSKVIVQIIDPGINISEENQKKMRIQRQIQENIRYQKDLLKELNISFFYYQNLTEFQRKRTSRVSEFVICFPDILSQVIDSRSANEDEYEIIVREDERLVKKKDQRKIWFASKDFKDIANAIKKCTSFKVEENLSTKTTNNFLCGGHGDWVYGDNFQRIKNEITEKYPQKIGENTWRKLNLKFYLGKDKEEEFLYDLRKQVFSVVVVWSADSHYQYLKDLLLKNDMHTRVQLTKIPEPKENDRKKFGNELESILQFKLNYFYEEVKFKMKFEIAPIKKLFLYHLSDQLKVDIKKTVEIEQFVSIRDDIDLKQRFLPPIYHEYIQGLFVLTNIAGYFELVEIIQQYEEKLVDIYIKKLKIIILDNQESIEKFVQSPSNYTKNLVFIHYSLLKIEQFLQYCRGSTVASSFFGSGLKKFELTAKQIATLKKAGQLSLNASVVSTNQLLKEVFKEKIRLSIDYKIDMLQFASTVRGIEQEIAFYEDRYLTDYSKLWNIGYSLIKEVNQSEGGSKGYHPLRAFENLDRLKKDIKACFYKCKSYKLLKVTDQEFRTMYIDKIDECKYLIDLQIACIYILSLPHGLSAIISNIFKRPRKSLLAIKIFCHFILVILTAFCLHEHQLMENIELISFSEDPKIQEKLKHLKSGDIVYTSSFVYCCKNQAPEELKQNNSLIFEFDNIPFLSKSRLKSTLDIERFSFYKQGAEYLIAPFTKFVVNSITKSENGKFLVRFSAKNQTNQSTFLHKVLSENGLEEQCLYEVIANELNKDNFTSQLKMGVKDKASLYELAEALTMRQSKIQLINSLRKELIYDQFFFSIKNKSYFSAEQALQAKLMEIKSEEEETGFSDFKNQYFLKMMNLEKSYVCFKTGRFLEGLNYLYQLKKYLIQQGEDREKWILIKVNKFISALKNTYQFRKKILSETTKTKKWKVKALILDGKGKFKLKIDKQMWQTKYVESKQKFVLSNQKEPEKLLTVAEPENQYGENVLSWVGSNLYDQLKLQENDSNMYWKSLSRVFSKKQQKQADKDQNYLGQRRRLSSAFSNQIIEQKKFQELPYSSIKEQANFRKKDKKVSREEEYILRAMMTVGGENEKKYITKKSQQNKHQRKEWVNFVMNQTNLYEGEELAEIEGKIEWKVFYFDEKVHVTQKGKHFHKKMGLKGKTKFVPRYSKVMEQNFILD